MLIWRVITPNVALVNVVFGLPAEIPVAFGR
jgi:hypothetical protein